MIDLREYSYFYDGISALDKVSLHVKENEKVALIGCNGSGKSTLLRVMAGLYFGKGKYSFKGNTVNKKSVNKEFRKKVGIIFQNPESMIFNPSVYDEIAFSLKEFGFEDIDDRVNTIAKEFDLVKILKTNPLNLSGGQKQKVVLASILVYEPELLLLDEPTAAMDPFTTGWFIDFLSDLDKSVVLATHDLGLAYEITQRAVVMDEKHKKLYDGDMESLFSDFEMLLSANLIHEHRHNHRRFFHSHYHLH